MKITTSIKCSLATHGDVTVKMVDEAHTDTPTVAIQQDESHTVWIPRTDIAEFCRVLTEWEAGQ